MGPREGCWGASPPAHVGQICFSPAADRAWRSRSLFRPMSRLKMPHAGLLETERLFTLMAVSQALLQPRQLR